MRLAILADPIDNQHAGIHVFTVEMVNALIRTNPGHEILLIREKRNPNLTGTKQIALWNTRLPIGYASMRLFLIVPVVLHFNKVDVVVEPAHFGPFNLGKKIKRVTIIHDLTPILFPELHRWHSQLLQKIFLKRILNKADLIIANSGNTAKDICKVYPQNCKKIKQIYPGKNRIYGPLIGTKVLDKYNIHNPYFLFVGTIEPRKNLLVLLEAFRIFKEEKSSKYSLIIVGGKGWKSKSFFQALRKHPFREDIHWLGYVDIDDMPALYSKAVSLIYPSLYEGFGLPVIEAMSCGTPVIVADNSALREAGGNIARYFKSDDRETLALHLTEIAMNPTLREKLSVSMTEHLKKFDWDNFARQTWTELETLK